MPEDRAMNQHEIAHELAEAQIGSLQAYAMFMEELVAAMLVARLADSRAAAIEQKFDAAPELIERAMVERAQADAGERNEAVRTLFEKGAPLRLACAKVGALPLDKPMVEIPDPPPGLGLH